MTSLIRTAISYQRTVLLLLAFFLLAGTISYLQIPKESAPDIPIPLAIVSVTQRGITPQDAESLLIKPLESKLRSLQGLKELKAKTYSGGGYLICEFFAGLDINKLLSDVRTKVDLAKSQLPQDADDPIVEEVNLSLFPVLAVQLSGKVPQKILYKVAEDIQDRIEGLSQVMKAPLIGKRNEVIEFLLSPTALTTYKLNVGELISNFSNNHRLIESGSLTSSVGSFPIKVPGLLKDHKDLLSFPLKTDGKSVLTYGDIGTVSLTYEDPTTFARSNGEETVVIEVQKRIGENIIETIQEVRAVVEQELAPWEGKIKATFAQDESEKILERLYELQNSIISAVILVMLVIIFSLGTRSAVLVGIAIPGAFLMSLFFLNLMGITLNIIVLFSLILSVGMLVDGAIIVVEYADRKMVEGASKSEAYREASTRMAWPVISSLVTVIVVFMPLLFWPGVVGEFMKYLPLTLILTLSSSLFMALIFVPTLGSLFGAVSKENMHAIESIKASEDGPLESIKGVTGWYIKVLDKALAHSWKIIGGATFLLVAVLMIYRAFNNGVEFFPTIETDRGIYLIHARGNLSVYEQDKIVRDVEETLLRAPEFKIVYATSGTIDQASEDTIGKILVELVDWKKRESTTKVLKRELDKVNIIPGVIIEVDQPKPGPTKGKPITIQVVSPSETLLEKTTQKLRDFLEKDVAFQDIEDSRPLPGIEWRIDINREEASRFNQTIASVGFITQLLTKGLKIGEYRPDSKREEIDVVVRYPTHARTLNQLFDLRVPNGGQGEVPLANFAKIYPTQKVGMIHRTNGKRYYEVKANISKNTLVNTEVMKIKKWIEMQNFDPQVQIVFKGEEEDKKETQAFLLGASVTAIFLILLVLVTQFNSFFNASLVLTSVVFSTFGVLIGLLVCGMPFGIVMGGLGIIALAGIIVSNNIIFIDTYEIIKNQAKTLEERRVAIIRTGAQRLRPVFLTKLTTILGLLPIRARLDIDFISGSLSYGAPSTEWWIQLSNAIIWGVLFASPLTLVLTPCILYVKERFSFRNKA